MTSTSDNSQRRVPWFWGGFFAVIGFGVVLALFAGIRAGLQWTQVEVENAMPPPVAALVKVTLAGGEALYVDPASVDSIRAQTREWLATRSTDTTAPLHDIIDRETAVMLVAAEAQIPTFADWYFSLAGEYARLLHAATDDLRDTLVPINRRYPLDQLLAACRDYVARTRRRISFEWALIAGVNDTLYQARALAERVRGLMCHVNLIPLNPTLGYAGSPSRLARVTAFRDELERHGIPSTVRVRRGIDIQAGCGQLREREVK